MRPIAYTLTLLLLLARALTAAGDIVFPVDSGVIDVTRPPYNAVPDDGRDDTPADSVHGFNHRSPGGWTR